MAFGELSLWERAILAPATGKPPTYTIAYRRRQVSFEPGRPLFIYALLFLIIVFFGLIRFHLRDTPLERDEGEFAYAGQLMLHGIPPYQLEYTMKLPGTAAAYATLMGLFGESSTGIHVGLILVNALTTFLVFLLARRLFGNVAGLIAGASYALFSTSPLVLGFAAHATNFVVLFATVGIVVLLQALDAEQPWLYLLAGVLFGISSLMKQPGFFFLAFAGIYILYRTMAQTDRTAPLPWKKLLQAEVLLTVGAIIPLLATGLLILKAGVFERFWFWTFQYAREYASGYLPARNWGHAIERVFGQSPLEKIGRTAVMLLSPILLIVTYLWSGRARSQVFFTISLFLISLAAVCPGLYFRRHYFILLLPAVAVLIGMVVTCIAQELLERRKPIAVSAVPLVVFVLAFVGVIFAQHKILFQMSSAEVSRYLYANSPFPEIVDVSQYINGHTADHDTVAVIGSEPEVFFYSSRHSASGYIYMYPFVEPQKYSAQMQQDMIGEIEKAQPEMLVFVHVQSSWGLPFSDISAIPILDWMRQYVPGQYTPEGVVEVGDTSEYHWGRDAQQYAPRSAQYISVYRRKKA